MRELREETFSENKEEDAHDHVDQVLSIVGLFNIPEVSKDAVMLRVFPLTLTGSAKRWVDILAPRTINTWDLLKKAFIKRLDAKFVKDLTSTRIPLNEEVKQVKEVRYGEFGQTTPFNGNNGGKFRVGPPGYYTKTNNRPSYGKKGKAYRDYIAKHQEESARRSTEMEIEQLTKEIHSDKTLNSSSEQIKTVTADQETSGLNKLHGVSFISGHESDTSEVLQH
ncbi:hypothetical protein Tco_0383028 [Tanacetum coccineum]